MAKSAQQKQFLHHVQEKSTILFLNTIFTTTGSFFFAFSG